MLYAAREHFPPTGAPKEVAMRLHVVLDVGAWPRIQVAEGELSPGHLVMRHYYRTGLPAQPRARVVTHTTRYECTCGRQWFGKKPTIADLMRHDEVAPQ